MCGIAAVIGCRPDEREVIVGRLLQKIAHRGVAQCADEYTGGEHWGLGVNRLPIESLTTRRQPRVSANRRIILAYNGEIYNWKTLSKQFAQSQDVGKLDETQCLVELISRSGSEGLRFLDGMFAICWVDLVRRSMFFARDGFGIKPLYFAFSSNYFVLASELKALSNEEDIIEISWAEPGVLYRVDFDRINIHSLETTPFFSLTELACGEEPAPEELLNSLDEAVYRCLDTQRRTGILLSGGVDSSAVLSLGLRHRQDLVAVCGGRAGASDVNAALGISSTLGVKVVVGRVPSEEALFSTVMDVIRIVESFEPNLVRQGSASLFLSKMARDFGLEVLLCGEGADELFCGYPEFASLSSEEIRKLRLSFLQDLHRTQLQRVDRTSMAFTLEVRVPFLCRNVVACALRTKTPENLFAVHNGEHISKVILRKALYGVLPDDWRMRPKVVLSEGMGLGGNDPQRGMFSRMIAEAISTDEVTRMKEEYAEWDISSAEEALYFREFNRLGYTKLLAARQRVCANRVNSLT